MIRIIAAKELRSLFLSPLAWTILAVVEFILAYLFLSSIDAYSLIQPRLQALPNAPGITELIVGPLFGNAAIVLLLVIPLLSMRTLAEEHRSGTISLLLSAPASMTEIVIGKYLGLIAFLAILIGLLALMPLSLYAGGSLDLGRYAAALLSIGLLTAAFAAVGLFMSTLTRQPVIAAITTFGALLLLWILDWSSDQTGHALISQLSLLKHYQPLLNGLLRTSDIVFFLAFIAVFLALSIRRLDNQRIQG